MNDWVRYFETSDRNIFDQCIRSRRLIELIIQNSVKGSRILEAGCGTALLSLILADYGYEVTALDVKEDVLKYAQGKVNLTNVKMEFVQGNILTLSSIFPKHHFDLICHSGVMEHFEDQDIVKSLTEQKVVSNKIIFSIPNNRTKPTSSHFGDERFLSNNKWLELIRMAGFNKVKLYGGYDLPRYLYFILPGLFFHRKASFWWNYFSYHSIFVCQ